ncbi:protease [Streptomyces sulfonofaciens]|uniref:Protease n=1 Tax=Streptomyces sulfonofaciens TaxID=68272 RepID=A0A919FYU2_9ACTN|nr:trypsin-like peptidase domain-containing protein [Streptomyces sulfonofaciens]GHH74444.1 protease [Streptomyces sulfonofaciens]
MDLFSALLLRRGARAPRAVRSPRSGRSPLRGWRLRAVVFGAGCAVLLGGCTDGASGSRAPGADEDRGTPSSRAADGGRTVPLAATDLQNAYERVIRQVLPSVVQIQGSRALGSGIVYDSQGHVVTNAHVVGREKSFKVTTANSEQTLTARLVYAYAEQDLAVVRLDRVPAGLRAASFGDSSSVEVGQIVLAMGSPLGLSSSVTQGIVSATGRTVTEGGGGNPGGGTGATITDMVQTSAAINPGNSGGALVGLDSKVIGIPTLAATDPDLGGSAAPGIGFAIPSRTVTAIAGQIIRSGRVTDSGRAALGITARTVLGNDSEPDGVAVVRVRKGGAADRAGIGAGDIITRLGGTRVTTVTSLTEALARRRPGAAVRVTYVRGGDEKTVRVTLGTL